MIVLESTMDSAKDNKFTVILYQRVSFIGLKLLKFY